MWVTTRIKIGGEKPFLSVGPAELLQNIVKYHSIKKATEAMGMSYTKALRIIRTMEDELGFAVVVSEKGGNSHGMTQLTAEGEQVLQAFQAIYADVAAYAEQQVKARFNF